MAKRQDAFSIGPLAERSGVNIETIRYYERIGLMPRPPRSQGGYRLYGGDDVARLRFVRRARDLGFTLDEVRRLLGLAAGKSNSCRRVRDVAAHHLADIRGKIADLERMERVLGRLVAACAKGDLPDCPLLAALANDNAGQDL
ncbi:MAG TPA: helix-turn-helix domain-containing protein [Reyranella sp.]|jgi:MerR family mercuric resistance operon transcriptional regulator|nr:helix-turn-helix domain-containing protein [Reyranella sp.]